MSNAMGSYGCWTPSRKRGLLAFKCSTMAFRRLRRILGAGYPPGKSQSGWNATE